MMKLFIGLLLLTCPLALQANSTMGSGIVAGLTNPIFELHHLLAIFGMGLYAKQNFRDGAWPIIFAFVLAMILGGIIGIKASPFQMQESLIVGSVLLYGVLLGLNIKMVKMAFIAIGLFIGLLHGYAHGVAIPDSSTPIEYIPGSAVGALIIAAFGEYIGRHLDASQGSIVRFLGGFILGMGLMSIFS